MLILDVIANTKIIFKKFASLIFIVGWLATNSVWGNTNVVTAQSQIITKRLKAYAQVEPITALPVRVAETGEVSGLKVFPGNTVQAGQKLAKLSGPEIAALLTQDVAAVDNAQTNLVGAQKLLTIQRQKAASQLSTQQSVFLAKNDVANAQANLDAAQARLQTLRQTKCLKAPVNGTVLAVSVTDGERIDVGQTLLTLQPADKLWVKAAYYGADTASVQVGMTGQFSPADGSEAIPVKVCSVFGSLNPDGGESVGLVATTSKTEWLNGEFGTVTLNGAKRSLISVPTRALILDRGQWWVLVHTSSGNHPQVVTPGSSRGWQTFIKRGLKSGVKVVVKNAYLEFHRSISQSYQPPD